MIQLIPIGPGRYEIPLTATRGELDQAAPVLRARGYAIALKTETDGPHIYAEARTWTA